MSDIDPSDIDQFRERRFAGLWTYELAAAGFLVVLYALGYLYGWFQLATMIGMLSCIMLLLQGSFCWFAKLRGMQGRPVISKQQFVVAFRRFRVIDVVLLILFGFALVYTIFGKGTSRYDAVFGVLFFVGGIAAYVNYFHLQLIYDNAHDGKNLVRHRRLKPAVLSLDLAGRDPW